MAGVVTCNLCWRRWVEISAGTLSGLRVLLILLRVNLLKHSVYCIPPPVTLKTVFCPKDVLLCFPEQRATISLNINMQLAFMRNTLCHSCKAGTEFFNTLNIYPKLVLRRIKYIHGHLFPNSFQCIVYYHRIIRHYIFSFSFFKFRRVG
jgi:hypothetical protein